VRSGVAKICMVGGWDTVVELDTKDFFYRGLRLKLNNDKSYRSSQLANSSRYNFFTVNGFDPCTITI